MIDISHIIIQSRIFLATVFVWIGAQILPKGFHYKIEPTIDETRPDNSTPTIPPYALTFTERKQPIFTELPIKTAMDRDFENVTSLSLVVLRGYYFLYRNLLRTIRDSAPLDIQALCEIAVGKLADEK